MDNIDYLQVITDMANQTVENLHKSQDEKEIEKKEDSDVGKARKSSGVLCWYQP